MRRTVAWVRNIDYYYSALLYVLRKEGLANCYDATQRL